MAKAKKPQKASATIAPKTKTATNQIKKIIENRLIEIDSALAGTTRLRRDRWHGSANLFDIHRMRNILTQMASSNIISYETLMKCRSIPSFARMMGPQLVQMLGLR